MYKVGDIVLVRDDLIPGQLYGGLVFLDGMKDYKGQFVTIKKNKIQDSPSYNRELYQIREGYQWIMSREMLCDAPSAEVEVSDFL